MTAFPRMPKPADFGGHRWLAMCLALTGIAALAAATVLALHSHSAEATTGPCNPVQTTPSSQALQLFSGVNSWRQSNLNEPAMGLSTIASNAAQWFAEDMIAGQAYGHSDQYGRIWWQRLEDCGFSVSTAQGSGEALAGFGGSDPTYGSTVQQAITQMTTNAGDSNAVNAPVGWQCVGVGYAANPNAQVGQDTYAWVVVATQTGPGGWNTPCDTPSLSTTTPSTPVGTATFTSTNTPSPSSTGTSSPTSSPTPSPTPTRTPTPQVHRAYAPMLAHDHP